MNVEAIKDLIYRYADDELIIGHRNSEWTGMGPVLEEDIAFSSMAQDEVGHAQAFYILMHELMGEGHPDQVAFNRAPSEFRSCHLVEYPIGDYAFSLVRHFLYDSAEAIRLNSLSRSTFRPLGELAKKLSREEKYHQLHAETWIRQLGPGTPESNARLQQALNEAYPLAFSLFEPGPFNEVLAKEGIQATEEELQELWVEKVESVIVPAGLKVPEVEDITAHYGGRSGKHTEHLSSMLKEMTEVFVIDPQAAW